MNGEAGGRRSGRTHGMVKDALRSACDGHNVAIVVHSMRFFRYIKQMLSTFDITGATWRRNTMALEPDGGTITLLSDGMPDAVLLWRLGRRNTAVFTDHHVWECQARRRQRPLDTAPDPCEGGGARYETKQTK